MLIQSSQRPFGAREMTQGHVGPDGFSRASSERVHFESARAKNSLSRLQMKHLYVQAWVEKAFFSTYAMKKESFSLSYSRRGCYKSRGMRMFPGTVSECSQHDYYC